ncbi:MAG: hypothetical protein GOV01_00595 [Candidatus Altiarchaeota archaeon]|nr:hypothetical protein [Candidatus Altiarchaeota archaeon]
MRGVTQVITVVMAVIIAASIMVISFKILGTANRGIDDIKSSAATQQQRLTGIQGLSQACDDWVTGDKFDAEAILKTYKLPDKMRPYTKVYDACGRDLEDVAKTCFNEQDITKDCAGNGFIISSIFEMSSCTMTCSNIKSIFSICDAACSSNSGQCFEIIVNGISSSGWYKPLDLTEREITNACEGKG